MGARRLTSRCAVFLDRDGVLNRNVLNPATGDFEAPLRPAQFALIPGVSAALAELQADGLLLILVSNQPNYAKGKSSLATLGAIHRKLEQALADAQVRFAEFNYCLHHPAGLRPAYSGRCACRKPSPYFLLRARDRFNLDLGKSWMIGDRLTDVACGQAAGVRTILIGSLDRAPAADHAALPEFVAPDLAAAAHIVIRAKRLEESPRR